MAKTVKHKSHLAKRRNSTTLHIVTGVANFVSGMALTSECGVKHCDVLDFEAVKTDTDTRICKRCRHTLGWDL